MLRPAELIEPLWVLIKVGRKKKIQTSPEKRGRQKKKRKTKRESSQYHLRASFLHLEGVEGNDESNGKGEEEGRRWEGEGEEDGK
jgi:hypothetical protein